MTFEFKVGGQRSEIEEQGCVCVRWLCVESADSPTVKTSAPWLGRVRRGGWVSQQRFDLRAEGQGSSEQHSPENLEVPLELLPKPNDVWR